MMGDERSGHGDDQIRFAIRRAYTADDLVLIRELFTEYAESLGFDLSFQDFADELRTLPGAYREPEGCLLLARHDEVVAGCVALRPLGKTICEMKRMYVRPPWRGYGLGRLLAISVIDAAREKRYVSMRLDTIASMHAARALYASLGFREISAYRYNPLVGAVYMECILSESGRDIQVPED